MGRQRKVLRWAIKTFGAHAGNVDERAARVAEEAMEMAQAAGVSSEMAFNIVSRVYSRPPGNLMLEIGAVALTLESMCQVVGTHPAAEAQAEWERVAALPPDHWKKRHGAKIEFGTSRGDAK